MSELDDEAAYLLRRAREEKDQAEAAAHPSAIAAHRALAERYATRAFMAQIDADDDPLVKKVGDGDARAADDPGRPTRGRTP